MNSVQLNSSIEQTIKQNVTPLNIHINQDNKATESFKLSQTHDTGNTNQLLSPLKHLNIVISPAEVNYHRKVKFDDVDINKDTKENN